MTQQDVVPADLNAYLNLDLSQEGRVAQALYENVDLEAVLEEIRLSDVVGARPADITPQMEQWYQTHVEPLRGPALHAVAKALKERTDTAHGDAFLLQSRLDSLHDDLLRAKRQCFQDHNHKAHSTTEAVQKLEKRIGEQEHQYNMRRAELNREAKLLNRPLYLFVLICAVFGPEAALNLESFEALPWATPFIAWGATALIGLAIGFAAHFHGTVLKQYAYYFGAAEDDTKRGPAWRMVLGGLAALGVALWFVYYARSAYLLAYVSALGGFDSATQRHGDAWIIGGSLLGNVIVYLVGSLWAFLMHDSDPDFVELKKSLDANKEQCNRLKLRLDSERWRDIEQIMAVHKKKREEAERAARLVSSQPTSRWPLELFKKLQAKDSQVVAILNAYRNALVRGVGSRQKDVRVITYTEDPHSPREPITLGDYHQKPLRLKYGEGV